MRHASSELIAIHIGLVVIAVVGVASALWHPFEAALNTACFGALAIAALLAGLRWLARFIRERIEDRADARYAAAVRAAAQERETIQ